MPESLGNYFLFLLEGFSFIGCERGYGFESHDEIDDFGVHDVLGDAGAGCEPGGRVEVVYFEGGEEDECGFGVMQAGFS